MQHTERAVAVAGSLYVDAQAHQIVDLLEVPTAYHHLLIDRVVVLRSTSHGRSDLGSAEVGVNLVDDPREILVATRGSLGDEPHDFVVNLGIQGAERQV